MVAVETVEEGSAMLQVLKGCRCIHAQSYWWLFCRFLKSSPLPPSTSKLRIRMDGCSERVCVCAFWIFGGDSRPHSRIVD